MGSVPQLLLKVRSALEVRLGINPGLSSVFLVLYLTHQRSLLV